MSRLIKFPNTNWGWYQYYVKRFNKTQDKWAAFLAMAYLNFHYAYLNDDEFFKS